MRLIQLLEQKNHYLEQFYSLNHLQLNLLQNGETDTLNEFYEKREKILDILSYIDNQTAEAYKKISLTEQNQTHVLKLLFIKDEYVHRILEQEMHILSKMDQMKTGILSELIDIKNTRKALKGYHSHSYETQLKEKA
jgi:hypothetical protein